MARNLRVTIIKFQPKMVPKSPMARREKKQGAPITRFYPVTKEAVASTGANAGAEVKSPRKQKTRHSDNPPVELSVGWLLHPKGTSLPLR